MSFSKIVKEEVIKKNIFKKETKSFLQGLFLSTGSLIIADGKLSFIISNENESVIEFAKMKLETLFAGVDVQIIKVVKSFKQKERFELSVSDYDLNQEILEFLGIIIKDKKGSIDISDVADKEFMASKDKMIAFLAGIFLGTGTVSVPSELGEKRRYGYHLEMVLSSKNQSNIVCEALSNFEIFPKEIERNEQYVVYLKNSDTICDILSLLGANKVVLDVLNQRVSRDMNNMTNRQMNCYTANVDKTMTAAVKQMIAIEIIQNTIGIESLPDNLAETALVRLANPESSLKDLLTALGNKITKGALAQRFNKIIEIANELGDNDVK
ncbi:MAG: DNA-binding protein WhiA [Clostridia bacterium]|nr:DNA-binding protein WhiA [Clostridia bacterium]